MSFDHDPKAGPQVYGGRAVLHNMEMHNEFAVRAIYRRLSDQLAITLTEDATVVTPREYSVEYDLRVYVLTPSQLARMVQQKAEELSRGYPTMTFDVDSKV